MLKDGPVGIILKMGHVSTITVIKFASLYWNNRSKSLCFTYNTLRVDQRFYNRCNRP